MFRKDWLKDWTRPAAWTMALAGVALTASTATAATNPNVPSIVISSAGTVPVTGLPGDASNVALDACGNIYTLQQYGGAVVKIPYGGGAATTIVTAGGANYDPAAMWIDAAKANLYVAQGTSGVQQIPIAGCVPQTAASTSLSIPAPLSYYWNASAIATDAAGDIFFGTDVDCCDDGNELFELVPAKSTYPDGTAKASAHLVGQLGSPITSIALDAAGNIYYVSGGAVFELAAVTDGYSSTPVAYGSGYTNAVGVAIDSIGNLFIADGGASTIFEIPYETTSKGSALNPADQFILATGVSIADAPAIAPSGNMYFADNGSSVYELTLGSAILSPVNVGSSGAGTVNVVFNAAETPASFALTSSSGAITATGGTCAGGTAYAAGSSCTITASFAPLTPGVTTGSVSLADSTGAVLDTAYLSATGLGAGITLDSGAVSSLGAGFMSPKSVAVDAAGNTYIADAGSNAVFEFKSGSATAISLGAGLSKPSGVAVDGAGNVLIADTGNNQIVEVPVIAGALSNSSQITLVSSSASISGSALNAPAGITVDSTGNLYIADTGNNRIVYLPYNGSWNIANASALGSDLTGPLATAVDATGNVYVADSGSGQIYRLNAPVSSGIQLLVGVGYSNPSALATDASGSLFVVDQGAGTLIRIPNVSGALNPNDAIEVGLGIANPYGVAVDPAGNLYVTDSSDAAAYQINRTGISEAFGSWAVNASSGPEPVKVENEGNLSLTFSTPFYTASGNTADFSLGSAAAACANGAVLTPGAGCELDATFTPTATGARSETIVLSANSSNTASPQIVLSGTGAAASATTTSLAITSPASGSPFFGQPIALTATVASSAGTPTGSVSLLVDGVIAGTAPLSGGTASFSLATGLTGGSHSLQAVYLASGSFDGSTSSPLAITVTTAPTTTTMAVNAPFTNPLSALSGNAVTFTVTVNSTGVGIPTGTVSFSTGGASLGAVPLEPAAGGAFQASLTTTALPVGTDNVTASYSGDANYIGSSASATVIVVSSSQVALTTSGLSLTSSSTSQSSVTFTATSLGGWTGLVGFSCLASSLPANAQCVWSPGQATVFASNSTASFPIPTVKLSITIDNPSQTPTAGKLVWWVAGLTGLGLFWMRRRLRKLHSAWGSMAALLVLSLLGIGASTLTACGGGSKNTTPATTSVVTVYASADPYVAGSTTTTQSCGINPTTNAPDPTLAPCAQKAYQVSLTVQ